MISVVVGKKKATERQCYYVDTFGFVSTSSDVTICYYTALVLRWAWFVSYEERNTC